LFETDESLYPSKTYISGVPKSEGNEIWSGRMEAHRNGGAGELGAVELHGVGGLGVGRGLPIGLGVRMGFRNPTSGVM